ncbi:MAG: response regulator [Desulfobacteraceae bacterium]|nr:response regulator [Desulfobacteraceae bacterium]
MKKYYSIPQAAKLCSISRATMHRWVVAGKIKSHRTAGGHHRLLSEDFNKWLSDNEIPVEIEEIENERIKILIVDDEVSIQKYLIKILAGVFVDIELASSGFEAGKKLIQFQPDLIILDLYMPNMDGFEVCEIVKKDPSSQKIKILILSGHDTLENREKALSLGADAFLSKPSSKQEIIGCVENLLKSKKSI